MKPFNVAARSILLAIVVFTSSQVFALIDNGGGGGNGCWAVVDDAGNVTTVCSSGGGDGGYTGGGGGGGVYTGGGGGPSTVPDVRVQMLIASTDSTTDKETAGRYALAWVTANPGTLPQNAYFSLSAVGQPTTYWQYKGFNIAVPAGG